MAEHLHPIFGISEGREHEPAVTNVAEHAPTQQQVGAGLAEGQNGVGDPAEFPLGSEEAVFDGAGASLAEHQQNLLEQPLAFELGQPREQQRGAEQQLLSRQPGKGPRVTLAVELHQFALVQREVVDHIGRGDPRGGGERGRLRLCLGGHGSRGSRGGGIGCADPRSGRSVAELDLC
jgi:hypothetical protein